MTTTIDELRSLQRHRSIIIKSRIMQANRLCNVVAGTELGYHSGMEEKERKRLHTEAATLIKNTVAGKAEPGLKFVILATHSGIKAFDDLQAGLEKQMVKFARTLPIAAWVLAPEQKCFGLLSLTTVIGEAGDLCDYANPGKLWRRFGCAPWTFDGKTAMGSTWRFGKEGKLPAEEWGRYAYQPRRRSIAYLLGENIVKQNYVAGGERLSETDEQPAAGPYRSRYLQAKEAAALKHPDWTPKRCHLHGMLLATKLLLKNLWVEWRRLAGDLPADAWTGAVCAAS